MADLHGSVIALLAADGVDSKHLDCLRGELERRGARLHVVSSELRTMEGSDGASFEVQARAADASAGYYDGLAVPGGVGSVQALRADNGVLNFVGAFLRRGRPVLVLDDAIELVRAANAPSDAPVISGSAPSLDATCKRFADACAAERRRDYVDELSKSSFPASDSPPNLTGID